MAKRFENYIRIYNIATSIYMYVVFSNRLLGNLVQPSISMEILLSILYMDSVQPQAIALPSQWLLMPAMDLKYIQILQLTQHYTVSTIIYVYTILIDY